MKVTNSNMDAENIYIADKSTQSTIENVVVPQNVTYSIINDPEVPLGIYVKACKIYVQIKCYT